MAQCCVHLAAIHL